MEASDLHEPVNLGNPVEIPILEAADRIRDLTGTQSKVEFRPLPEDDPVRRQPDIGRARALLKWEPAVPLEEGLRQTVDYFAARLAAGK